MSVELHKLFDIQSGDFHALKELGPGPTPLVSCGDINHGFVGYFDIPKENRYANAVTVAYNGAPLTAKYRPYEFGAKDDIGILRPRRVMPEISLIYVASALNALRWRYSYGRKCFKGKLRNLLIDVPIQDSPNGSVRIDDDRIRELVGERDLDLRPDGPPRASQPKHTNTKWERKRLSSLFDLKRGDFHSLNALGEGEWTTVSRTTNDNGVVGRYERPDGSILYPAGTITVSTVAGDAFVQTKPFIATDNVIVLIPKQILPLSTICLLAAAINSRKWRYGYGRQCYQKKLAAMQIELPWKNGELDHQAAELLVSHQPYWDFFEDSLSQGAQS